MIILIRSVLFARVYLFTSGFALLTNKLPIPNANKEKTKIRSTALFVV
jgi:hypothetical protein